MMCMFEQLLKEYEDKLREEDKKNENKRIKTAQYDFYLPKIRDFFIHRGKVKSQFRALYIRM